MSLPKWMVFLGLAAMLPLWFAALAQADIALPPDLIPGREAPAEPAGYRLEIKYDREARHARLQIPRAAFETGALHAEPNGGANAGGARLRTAIAGLAMSLACVGLFFVWRKKGMVRPVAAAVVGVAVAIGAASTLWANGAPPHRVFNGSELQQLAARLGNDRVVVEVVERGDAITLILVGEAPAPVQKSAPPPAPPQP